MNTVHYFNSAKGWLKSRIFTYFCVALQRPPIFVAGNRRHFKFGMPIDHSKSRPTDDKHTLKWAWSGHVNHLNFDGYQSGMAEARVMKFCTQVRYIKSHASIRDPF